MKIVFNRILIPVDFTDNCNLAIQKALSLSEGKDATIHLLYISKIFSLNQIFSNNILTWSSPGAREAARKMESLKKTIIKMRPEVQAQSWISTHTSEEQAIIQKAKEVNADLIIIGKKSNHTWFSFLKTVVPSKVAKKSGIPVLTAKPGGLAGDIRSIVVPIGENFPEAKLAAINALKTKFRLQICLVAFLASKNDSSQVPATLLHAYRIIKNKPETQVTYEVLYGRNIARTVLKYCARINADLLIVQAESETKAGWLNKYISDFLPANSKTQILAILQS